MTIVYEKVMALTVPTVEVTYGPKDCMLYALGLGLGQDPMNEDELAFVYEKQLKVLPTMATVLGYGVSWAREAGIDQLRVVNGEQGFTLHKPLMPEATVVGHSRIVEVIDKGAGKGALILSERKVTDKASGELIATITQTASPPQMRALSTASLTRSARWTLCLSTRCIGPTLIPLNSWMSDWFPPKWSARVATQQCEWRGTSGAQAMIA